MGGPAGSHCHEQHDRHCEGRGRGRGQQRILATRASARGLSRSLSRGRRLNSCGLTGQIERRVLPQYRALKSLQCRAGLQAELLDQGPARRLVGLQRLGLPPAAVERDHQLPVQALTQRVGGDQRLKLADDIGVTAQRQV